MPDTSKFSGGVNTDKTSRVITNDFQDKAYAASIAVTTTADNTVVRVAELTGALTLTCGTTNPEIGNTVTYLFSVDGTNRVVTFGTGHQPSATLALTADKYGSATFMFNGTTWIETGRAVTA
jgi:hypothetical protein